MVVGTVRMQQPLRESSEVSGKLVTECEVYWALAWTTSRHPLRPPLRDLVTPCL